MSDKVIIKEARAVAVLKSVKLAHPEVDFEGWNFTEPKTVEVTGSARRALTVEDGRLVRLDLSGMGFSGRLAIVDLPHLEELSIMGADLDTLRLVNLPDLDTLLLDRAFGYVSDEPLELDELPVLRRLRANSCGIIDLSPFESLMTLEILELSQNDIHLLDSLYDLAMLSKLDLSDNEIDYLGPLEDAIDLEYLDISINMVGDLSPLSGLMGLSRLNVAMNPIESLEPLRGLSSLTDLNIDATGIGDLGALTSLGSLTVLYAGDNAISDLSPLAGLGKLVTLSLPENQIYELEGLETLRSLERLFLSDNEISDLSAISRLITLKELDVSFNRVSDLSPLKNLRNLRLVDVASNDISDISILEKLPRLSRVFVDGNGDFDNDDVALMGVPDDDRGPLDAAGGSCAPPPKDFGGTAEFGPMALEGLDSDEGEARDALPPSVVFGGEIQGLVDGEGDSQRLSEEPQAGSESQAGGEAQALGAIIPFKPTVH